ncbi:hypothetical protein VTN00DRAFT_5001 [Thermoascus crustaceus]|uniref:uncharacterized protein n=1 Tax=Thermoascus crustaceus TaxID=5088 RepID=UPI003743AA00
MPWMQTTPGVFSRPLGKNETYIKLARNWGHPLQRENWAIDSTATISPLGALGQNADTDLPERRWHPRPHLQSSSTAASLTVMSISAALGLLRAWSTPSKALRTTAWRFARSTFRNQLNLNIVYKEAFHPPEQMEQFVGTTKGVAQTAGGRRVG